MQAIIKAYNYVLNGLAVCAGLVIFAVFLLIVIDVTIRTAGFAPPAYTIAVAEYCLLFFTMFSAPWLVRMKGHVFIDAVTQMLPRPVQVVLAKVVYTLCVCSALIFAYISSGWLRKRSSRAISTCAGSTCRNGCCSFPCRPVSCSSP